MRILAALLLFANLALGLWNYTHRPVPPAVPRPVHPERLQVVSAESLQATPAPRLIKPVPEAPSAKVAPAPPAPQKPAPAPFKKTAFTAAVAAAPGSRGQCWNLGPMGRQAAAALLKRLHRPGRIVRHPGPPAYRLYLPAGAPWPSAATLHKLGIVGAYVTHGPSGGAVLSLGVFLRKTAALRERQVLYAHHVDAHLGPFGAPARYDVEMNLSSVSPAFWRQLGSVGHTPCGAGH
ncbi:MAG: hypothetical protein ACYCTF_03125 [Acidiferrobacter sp.]